MNTSRNRSRSKSGLLFALVGIAALMLVLLSALYFHSHAVIRYSTPRPQLGLDVVSPNATASTLPPPVAPLSSSNRSGVRAMGNFSRNVQSDADSPRQITTLAGVKEGFFFRLQEAASGQWLSRAIDTNVEASHPHEKTFLITFVKKYGAYALQGHTRMHLTCELNDRVTVDRMWARSFEMWLLVFDSDGFLLLKSRRNKLFVRTSGVLNDMLVADQRSESGAARWRLFAEPREACARPPPGAVDTTLPAKHQLEQRRNLCWGPLPSANASTVASIEAPYNALEIPLFGSPKPLKQLSPADPKNAYDPYIIARRTITNWASIDGALPFILADDALSQQLVSELNRDHNATSGFHHIALETKFEIQKKYKQPTYRGLFDAALRRFPDAVAVAYSNSDILFTSGLVETVRHVARYVDQERERKRRAGLEYKVRGWMIVGQRVNHDVPAEWGIDGRPTWAAEIERDFLNRGELFESDAEDYFIVSRGLFDWMRDIPDFVVGGVAFDNWIVNRANTMAADGTAIVVDGSKTITALHQNHGHDVKDSHHTPKSSYNSMLAVNNGGWTLGHTADAAYATDRRADGSLAVYDKHRLLYK